MSEDKPLQSTDSRRTGRDSDRKYLLLVIFTLVLVGGALIATIYGPRSLLTALPCLIGGAGLILLPWLMLAGLQKWRDRIDERAKREAAGQQQASESS